MTRLLVALALVFVAALLIVDYAYFKGFDDGADAYACVLAYQVDGPAAKDERPCKNVLGRHLPPPRIFPGSNGDEPTIWSPKDSPGISGGRERG